MSDDHFNFLEKRLQSELKQIEGKIRDLEAEKVHIGRQLARARADRTGLQHTTRKNSVNRVLAENAVLTALRDAKKPLSVNQLYRKAQETNYALKLTTFRTYLYRMKEKRLIKSARGTGTWEIPDKPF